MSIELVLGRGLAGKIACVIGRSKIVGTPMADLLKWNHCTVICCHSKSEDIQSVVRQSDIVVVAVGSPQMVKGQTYILLTCFVTVSAELCRDGVFCVQEIGSKKEP